MRRVLSILFVLSVLCVSTSAQLMVEIKPTKKVIHLDQMGLSDNMGVRDVLNSMPELLDRSSGDYFANFSIQVDGKDAGSSRDVVLTQTKIAEIDVIEISTSSSVSERKNGEGGVINIKLKPVTREGLSGEVLLDGNTEWDVQPSLLLNYKKNKFTLRSSLMMEYWAPTDYKEKYWSSPDETVTRLDTIKTRFCQETAKLHLQWNPTSRDEVKVYVWETYSYAKKMANAGEQTMTRVDKESHRILWQEKDMCEKITDKQRNLIAEGNVSYKHKYIRGGELEIEADYSYNPTRNERYWKRINTDRDMIYTGRDSLTDNKAYNHQVRGEISTKHLLLPSTSLHYLDIKSGVNTTYNFGRTQTITDIADKHLPPDTAKTNGNKLYVSPYLEMNYRYHGWELKVGTRYQYYRHAQQMNEMSTYNTHNHTWLGNASVLWNVKEHHALRLIISRDVVWSLQTAADGEISTKANPYYTADLNYVFDWNNNVDYIQTNFGIKYVYAQRTTADIGLFTVNGQLIYRHGIFSMAFAGNAYVKQEIYFDNNHSEKWRFHANLSLSPILSFRKNWTLSAKLLYNSEMLLDDVTYGDCFFTQLRLSKNWKNWNVHIELDDIFDYVTYNVYRTERGTEKELVDMYPRCVEIGASYKF